MTNTTEVMELSLEKVIETKLVQNNITDMVLAELKAKYSGMTLKAIDDKESYLELKEAAKVCAKLRTATVKACKEGRERAVKEQKLWVAKEKEIVGEIAIVEDPLDAEIKKFDDEVDRLANEEKVRQDEAFINRQATLTKMGAEYKDGSFVLGDASFESNLIKTCDNSIWENDVVPKYEAEYQAIEAIKIEEKRKRDEADAELKRKQDEFAQQQADFKKKQEELQSKLDEANRVQREKDMIEEAEKQKVKQDLQTERFFKMFPYSSCADGLDMTNLWIHSESAFIELLEEKKSAFKVIELERVRLESEKIAADIELAKQEAIKKEQDRAESIRKQEELERIAAEERKQAEFDASKDKVKWSSFIESVSKIEAFEMRSSQYRKKMAIAKEKLSEILAL